MSDYFKDQPERIAALRVAIESWKGTPFRKNSCAPGPGGGVACREFIRECLCQIGAINACPALPDYHVEHAQHSEVSLLLAWFRQPEVRVRFRDLAEDEPHVDGDLVFPKVGRCEHHIAFRMGGEVFHIVRPTGWCSMTLAQVTLHHSRYRLIERTDCEDCFT